MAKFCVLIIFGLIAGQVTSMNIRDRRQTVNSANSISFPGQDGNTGFINIPYNQEQFPNEQQFPNQNSYLTWQQWMYLQQLMSQQQFVNQQPQKSSTTAAPNNGGATTLSLDECKRTCPVTPEYNPVCGTNNQTYNNPGRLTCAQACGENVKLARRAPCPTP